MEVSFHYGRISKITIVSKYFEFFLSVNVSFLERFPEKSSRFHSNVGHYKEEFEYFISFSETLVMRDVDLL